MRDEPFRECGAWQAVMLVITTFALVVACSWAILLIIYWAVSRW